MTFATGKSVYDLVKLERFAQENQWGGVDHDAQHTPHDWCLFIDKQIDKAFDASMNIEVDGDVKQLDALEWKSRMIKIAALAIAAVQAYDKNYDD